MPLVAAPPDVGDAAADDDAGDASASSPLATDDRPASPLPADVDAALAAALDMKLEDVGGAAADEVAVLGEQAVLDEQVRAAGKDLARSLDATISSTQAWREAQQAKFEAMKAEALQSLQVEASSLAGNTTDDETALRCRLRPKRTGSRGSCGLNSASSSSIGSTSASSLVSSNSGVQSTGAAAPPPKVVDANADIGAAPTAQSAMRPAAGTLFYPAISLDDLDSHVADDDGDASYKAIKAAAAARTESLRQELDAMEAMEANLSGYTDQLDAILRAMR